MKKHRSLLLLVTLLFVIPCLSAQEKVSFDEYFLDSALRVDLFHTGNATTEEYTLDRLVLQPTPWAGNPDNLIDPFNNGRYEVRLLCPASGKLLFSQGYDTYFGEYKTTTPAINGVKKSYSESIIVPLPKNPVKMVISLYDRENKVKEIFSTTLDPKDYTIIKEKVPEGVKFFPLLPQGDVHKKVDIVVVGEGYTAAEEEKFQKDIARFLKVLLSQEPFKSNQEKLHFTGVFKASEESGTDEPEKGLFKRTLLSTTFSSLGLERYNLTEANEALREVTSGVPYDALYIMINTSRYGGGGIYNLYSVFTSDTPACDYVFLHEFGHSFGGLGDEYYTSSVAYNDFYPQGVEPREPNLTALLDPSNLKWKELATPGTPLPTLWEKERFESLGPLAMRHREMAVAELEKAKKSGASPKKIASLEAKLKALIAKDRQKNIDFLEKHPMRGKVGAYEGAGYASKGIYRPMVDCIMFSGGSPKPYCKVCEKRVSERIRFFSE